jgi:hypothetical protein
MPSKINKRFNQYQLGEIKMSDLIECNFLFKSKDFVLNTA